MKALPSAGHVVSKSRPPAHLAPGQTLSSAHKSIMSCVEGQPVGLEVAVGVLLGRSNQIQTGRPRALLLQIEAGE